MIVCTIFPTYDWIRQITKNHEAETDLRLLVDKGTDIHNYMPTIEDIAMIKDCDMFIYVGGESDDWVDEVLRDSKEGQVIINLSEVLADSVVEEEIVEGMQADEDDSEIIEEPEYDEHVWLSLNNAITIVEYMNEQLDLILPECADDFDRAAQDYREEIESLDKEYRRVVDNAKANTLIVADRFPFRYMAKDYGLNYYAAFLGCAAETEASFDTVVFLTKKLNELSARNIIIIENSDDSMAKTIINASEHKDTGILVLNSLQSVSTQDINDGVTYISLMRENLLVLQQTLN